MNDAPPTFDRRRAARAIAGAVLGLPLALEANGVAAGRQWCRSDPVIRIQGQTAHIYVSAFVESMAQAKRLANGPTRIVVSVPRNTPVRYVASDNGFGYGYDFVFEEYDAEPGLPFPIPVNISVRVPMKHDNVRIRAHFVPVGGADHLVRAVADGESNLAFSFSAP